MVLEKALAKMRGNYLHINGGQAYNGVRYLRGAPWERRDTKYMTKEEIWDFIRDNLSKGNLLTASSNKGSDTHNDPWGVVLGHAYTVAGTVILPDMTRLIKARNPWGKDAYIGRYGADSPQWTSVNLASVPDAQDFGDGYIYLPVDQFKMSFRQIAVNMNSDKMKMDYYLKLDDTSQNKPKKTDDEVYKNMYKDCGAGCTLHRLHVVSPSAQKVWISLNTWAEDTMPRGQHCLDPKYANQNSLFFPTPTGHRKLLEYKDKKEDEYTKYHGGTTQLGPYAFTKDSYQTVYIALNFNAQNTRPKDWSISAWGETGPVYVYNDDGSATAHYAKGEKMSKVGPKSKPAFDAAKLTKLDIEN